MERLIGDLSRLRHEIRYLDDPCIDGHRRTRLPCPIEIAGIICMHRDEKLVSSTAHEWVF